MAPSPGRTTTHRADCMATQIGGSQLAGGGMTTAILGCDGRAAWTLPGSSESVGRFRGLARAVAANVERAEAAALCLSELVTNALVHTRSGLPGGSVTVPRRRAQRRAQHLGSGRWSGDRGRRPADHRPPRCRRIRLRAGHRRGGGR